MHFSVILCTYNRAKSLRRCLDSFSAFPPPQGAEWELILVDNASTDDTPAVARDFARTLPVRYLHEAAPGQSQARNAGIRAAGSEFLIFTDDDVTLSEGWFSAYLEAEARYQGAAFFGGPIVPAWEGNPPAWVVDYSSTLLRGMCVYYRLEDQERYVTIDDSPFFGANMAFRKSVFDQGLTFRTDLGLKGNGSVRGEDAALIRHAIEIGHSGVYIPGASVYHHNPATRTTEKYMREWFYGAGIAAARCGDYPGTRKIADVPIYIWKRLIYRALGTGLLRYTASPAQWLPMEADLARTWGIIHEQRAQARSERTAAKS